MTTNRFAALVILVMAHESHGDIRPGQYEARVGSYAGISINGRHLKYCDDNILRHLDRFSMLRIGYERGNATVNGVAWRIFSALDDNIVLQREDSSSVLLELAISYQGRSSGGSLRVYGVGTASQIVCGASRALDVSRVR